MKYFARLSLIVTLFACVAFSFPPKQIAGEEIIARMFSVYSSCSSYLDEGQVKTVFYEKTGSRTVIKPFSTAYLRPAKFRFEYKERRGEEEWNRYIIWEGDEAIKTWWSIKPGIENHKTLGYALGGASGVSGAASTTIPGLLMPEMIMGNQVRGLKRPELVGEESLNDRNVYKIKGTDYQGNIVTIWIDSEKLLILKIQGSKKFEKFETETTMTFKPQLNIEIAPEKLAFDPPGL